MKFSVLSVLIFFLAAGTYGQIQLQWTSSAISDANLSGFIDFEKSGQTFTQRVYLLDSLSFRICQPGFSVTPQYTYTFNAAERLAGAQVYSMTTDLDGNGYVDFYIIGYVGTSTNYRQSMKIFDITTGAAILEKNDASFSYSYPTLDDADGNGLYELIIAKYPLPYNGTYMLEVYSTNVPSDVNENNKPSLFRLQQNYPNPFNPSTTIEYSVSVPGLTELKIYDISGQLIKTLVSEFREAGDYSVNWNGTDNYGGKVPSGIYFYRMNNGDNSTSRKMILLK
ncbi:MAG: T9SS type A sorting domain-containing protein [Ignavibacteriaceae bacterium]|nr:T9SS type A sorting domain-containing protein [Ignavibacteriaceae bacterium]